MKEREKQAPAILGLFQKRIEGDDALLELARRRFQRAGLGTEIYASAPDELEALMRFRPAPDTEVVVHLARNLNLLNEQSRGAIAHFAGRFAGRVRGFVVHDEPVLVSHPDEYLSAVFDLEARLAPIDRCPWVFIEYAAGIAPHRFAEFFERIEPCRRITAGIDSGHVGIWQVRADYSRRHPGEDICSLKPLHRRFPAALPDIESAVKTSLPVVLELITKVARIQKPIHFHLHDGHPASTFSPFGVSDHLSFFAEIPLPLAVGGRRALPTMFGSDGLRQIVTTARQAVRPSGLSFTLEIHPTGDRLPLSEDADLFSHWVDKTNAEKMNHWLEVLARNAQVVRQALE